MLSAKNRLAGYKVIEKVKKEGKLYQRRLFGVIVLKRDVKGPSRFAFVVSTKISKQAIQRNRIKRALREAVRYSLTYFNDNYDVIFLAKKSIAKKLTDEIMAEVKISFKEIGITK